MEVMELLGLINERKWNRVGFPHGVKWERHRGMVWERALQAGWQMQIW